MRAARYYGKEDIRIEEIEEPGCEEGQIKVKPAFVGICGTGRNYPPSSLPLRANGLSSQICTNT
jgi:threonine dehydrogenase-like Zn-dependent dehydrogenase